MFTKTRGDSLPPFDEINTLTIVATWLELRGTNINERMVKSI